MNRSFSTLAGLATIVLGLSTHALPARAAAAPSATFTNYPVPYARPYGIVYDDAGPLKGIWFTNATLDAKSGAELVQIDQRYFRPTEVEQLLGDASKARARLGWTHKTTFKELVTEMVASDLKEVASERDRKGRVLD